MSYFCSICQKKFKDILKHFSYYHELDDMEKIKKEIELAKNRNNRQEKFKEFVHEINENLKKKEITILKWKELRKKWEEEHPYI